MAKSGDIIATGSSAAIVAAVLGDLTPELTLGQAAAASLGGADDPLVLVLDLSTRTIKVFDSISPITEVDMEANGDAVFVQDDDSKKVTPWTGSGTHTGLVALSNTTAKPSRSLASLLSVVEDLLRDPTAGNGGHGTIIIDQINEKVGVFASDPSDVSDLVLTGPVATITQTIPTTDGHIAGPFE